MRSTVRAWRPHNLAVGCANTLLDFATAGIFFVLLMEGGPGEYAGCSDHRHLRRDPDGLGRFCRRLGLADGTGEARALGRWAFSLFVFYLF